MDKELTFDALWDKVKSQDEHAKEILECSEEIANIIQSIVRARIARGWSQRDLAAKCNLNQPAIARMETLQVVPRLDTIVKIAHKVDLKICTQEVPKIVSTDETKPLIIFSTIRSRYNWTPQYRTANAVVGG